jgi:hypothetical protein
MDETGQTTVAEPATGAVRWFEGLSRVDVPDVGGKGANLGELTRAGLPVPPGFVVTAPAYLRPGWPRPTPANPSSSGRRPPHSRRWSAPPGCPTS